MAENLRTRAERRDVESTDEWEAMSETVSAAVLEETTRLVGLPKALKDAIRDAENRLADLEQLSSRLWRVSGRARAREGLEWLQPGSWGRLCHAILSLRHALDLARARASSLDDALHALVQRREIHEQGLTAAAIFASETSSDGRN